jgi:hypothetical protein
MSFVLRFCSAILLVGVVVAQTPTQPTGWIHLTTLFEAFLRDHPNAAVSKTSVAEVQGDGNAKFFVVSAIDTEDSSKKIYAAEIQIDRNGQEKTQYLTPSAMDFLAGVASQIDRDREGIKAEFDRNREENKAKMQQNRQGTPVTISILESGTFSIMDPLSGSGETQYTLMTLGYDRSEADPEVSVYFRSSYPEPTGPDPHPAGPYLKLTREEVHQLSEAITETRDALQQVIPKPASDPTH